MKRELPVINDPRTKSDQPLFWFQRKSDHLPFSLIFSIKGQFLKKVKFHYALKMGKYYKNQTFLQNVYLENCTFFVNSLSYCAEPYLRSYKLSSPS